MYATVPLNVWKIFESNAMEREYVGLHYVRVSLGEVERWSAGLIKSALMIPPVACSDEKFSRLAFVA